MLSNTAPLATKSRQEIIPSCILERITSVDLREMQSFSKNIHFKIHQHLPESVSPLEKAP